MHERPHNMTFQLEVVACKVHLLQESLQELIATEAIADKRTVTKA